MNNTFRATVKLEQQMENADGKSTYLLLILFSEMASCDVEVGKAFKK